MKRRFIAGAVCPQCEALDRIVIESPAGGESSDLRTRACVACGFRDTPVTNPASTATGGRFDRRRPAPNPAAGRYAEPDQTDAVPVRIIERKPPSAPD